MGGRGNFNIGSAVVQKLLKTKGHEVKAQMNEFVKLNFIDPDFCKKTVLCITSSFTEILRIFYFK
jgi:hypothetical protein